MPTRFERGEDVFKFVAMAAVAAALAATIGTLAIAAMHASPAAACPIWWTWWQGDMTGIIVVTPLILSWAIHRAGLDPARNRAGFAALARDRPRGYVAFGADFRAAASRRWCWR